MTDENFKTQFLTWDDARKIQFIAGSLVTDKSEHLADLLELVDECDDTVVDHIAALACSFHEKARPFLHHYLQDPSHPTDNLRIMLAALMEDICLENTIFIARLYVSGYHAPLAKDLEEWLIRLHPVTIPILAEAIGSPLYFARARDLLLKIGLERIKKIYAELPELHNPGQLVALFGSEFEALLMLKKSHSTFEGFA